MLVVSTNQSQQFRWMDDVHSARQTGTNLHVLRIERWFFCNKRESFYFYRTGTRINVIECCRRHTSVSFVELFSRDDVIRSTSFVRR